MGTCFKRHFYRGSQILSESEISLTLGPISYKTKELGGFYILSSGAMWYGLVWEEIAWKKETF